MYQEKKVIVPYTLGNEIKVKKGDCSREKYFYAPKAKVLGDDDNEVNHTVYYLSL